MSPQQNTIPPIHRALAQASRILSAAEQQARHIIAAAENQAANRKEDHRALLLDDFLAHSFAGKHFVDAFLAQLQEELPPLIATICREVVGRDLRDHPESIVSRVNEALATLCWKGNSFVVEVCPEDEQSIAQYFAAKCELRRNPELSRGEARVVLGTAVARVSPTDHLECALHQVRAAAVAGTERARAAFDGAR